ncbi:MAG: hypothetical protein COA57_06705 [Flavobacteriales bacterium]|nr:MAG: hypothetical protein COA57_06705 [Flavobacteriales bacterium]
MLIALAMLYWGYNYIKGINILEEQNMYYAEYKNVDGLMDNHPIQLQGFTVGNVRNIAFHPKKQGTLVVGFVITDESVKIPKGSLARIVNLDLLGSKAIALEFNKKSFVSIELNDTIEGANQNSLTQEWTNAMMPVRDKAMVLITQMDTAIKIIQQILDKDARKNLSASFESIRRSFETFEQVAMKVDTMIGNNTRKFSRTMSNLDAITTNINRNEQEIDNILNNFSTFSDSLASVDMATTLKSADRALADVAAMLEKVAQGEGTVGQLLNDDKVYLKLDSMVTNMDMLLLELKNNPKKFMAPLGWSENKIQRKKNKQAKKAAKQNSGK